MLNSPSLARFSLFPESAGRRPGRSARTFCWRAGASPLRRWRVGRCISPTPAPTGGVSRTGHLAVRLDRRADIVRQRHLGDSVGKLVRSAAQSRNELRKPCTLTPARPMALSRSRSARWMGFLRRLLGKGENAEIEAARRADLMRLRWSQLMASDPPDHCQAPSHAVGTMPRQPLTSAGRWPG
jgi:hypothetical protein